MKPAEVAPARRNPPSIPGAPTLTLHAHYLRSTKGDRPCKRSSKTRPGPPPPTFQPERRPRPNPEKRQGETGRAARGRAGRLGCPALGGGLSRLSPALARELASLVVSVHLQLYPCVRLLGWLALSPRPRGSEGSWKRVVPGLLCFGPANVPPCGYLFPARRPALPATRGLPCTRSGCARPSVGTFSWALGAELPGSCCGPGWWSHDPVRVSLGGADPLQQATSSGSPALERPCGLSLAWGRGRGLPPSGIPGTAVSLELCAPLGLAPAGALCAPTVPAPHPPPPICGANEVGGRRRLASGSTPPRDTPTLPGRACRGCERPLPDPEVDHAQAEKEVAQAAPRFPVHSPRWPPGPRAGPG